MSDSTILGKRDAVANVAVKDLAVGRRFYEETLGLEPVDGQEGELVTFKSGSSNLNVYRSEYAGSNKATAVTWQVDSVEETVRALKAKGVAFEHYDMPGLERDGDVYGAAGMKVAWFKDPDGNILNVVSR